MSTSVNNIWKVSQQERLQTQDHLAIEEPLEIRIQYGEISKSISITMRTPGHDFELAAGFLYTEGIIQDKAQIKKIEHLKSWNPALENNLVAVQLADGVQIDFEKLERHFYTSSSCGVCGKASIDAVKATGLKELEQIPNLFPSTLIHQLPKELRKAQNVFDETGGLHAAALFHADGTLQSIREDVGRHNALDKLIGYSFLEASLPLHNSLLLLSGRVSFELIQKAAMAQIPVVAAVGAPSSLAIQLAKEVGITVLGFVRDQRFNIYSIPERIQ